MVPCCTVKACPAIVSDPFRAFDGLDATVKSTEPFPLPLDPEVTVIRKVTFGFAVLLAIVVALGYIPQYVTHEGSERLLFGLFRLSMLDDITHGITAVAALGAALTSIPACYLFLTAFGWYYMLDAIFFLTNGFFNELTWMQDIMLNMPHVLIGGLMLWLVYGRRREV